MAQKEAPRGAPVPKNVKKRDKSGKKINLRLVVQIFFFALIALIAVNHALEEQGRAIGFLSSASLHAVCPFGGVVSIYQYVTAGTYVHQIHESAFILMYIVFALALLVGPAFCGWVCPLGSFQEWIGKLGRKVSPKKFNKFIPAGIDRYLKYLRYGVLIWVVYVTSGQARWPPAV